MVDITDGHGRERWANCACGDEDIGTVDTIAYAHGWYGIQLTADCPSCHRYETKHLFFHRDETDGAGDYWAEYQILDAFTEHWFFLPHITDIERNHG